MSEWDTLAVNDEAAIFRKILENCELKQDGAHGPQHWARVYENGMRLAEITGADKEVVALFSLFHDSRRFNENHDPGHGMRGANLAKTLRGKLVNLDDRRFDLLYDACALHSDGLTTGDVTVITCWDADRLDLGRVGMTPSAKRLCTDAARDLIPWSHQNASDWYEPEEILKKWKKAL